MKTNKTQEEINAEIDKFAAITAEGLIRMHERKDFKNLSKKEREKAVHRFLLMAQMNLVFGLFSRHLKFFMKKGETK